MSQILPKTCIATLFSGLLIATGYPADTVEKDKKDFKLSHPHLLARPPLNIGPLTVMDLPGRIKRLSWNLLVAEIVSAKDGLQIYSEAYSLFQEGLNELKLIKDFLDADPARVSELSILDKRALVRFDVLLNRESEIRTIAELSRKDEIARISQLRNVVGAHRSLNSALVEVNTQFVLGDYKGVTQSLRTAQTLIEKLKSETNARKEYYLLSDEPRIDDGKKVDENQLLNVQPPPYASDVLTHFESTLAYSLFKIANADPKNLDVALLAEVLKIAGPLAKNPGKVKTIGLAAQGGAALLLAKNATKGDYYSAKLHLDAAPLRTIARAAFGEIVKADPKAGFTPELLDQAKSTIEQLESPRWFLDQIGGALEEGNYKAAVEIATQGLLLHRDARFLQILISASLQGTIKEEQIQKEIAAALSAQFIQKDDPILLLGLARLNLEKAWKENPASQIQLANEATTQLQEILKPGRALQNDPVFENLVKTYYCLAQATKVWANRSGTTLPEPMRQQLGKDLLLVANTATQLENLYDNKTFVSRKTEIAQGVIAARQTQGFLSLLVLPDYSDAAAKAFASAGDWKTRASFNPSWIKATALQDFIAMRPDAKNYQLLLEERSIRQGLAQFLDGALGIATGADSSSPLVIHRAWDQFTNRKSNTTDATAFLSLDSKKEMTELLRATSILTLLEKGDQLELAKKVACPLLSETPQTKVQAANADLITQFQMAQSPVLKFALARFAEEWAASVGSIASKENEALRQWAKAANAETVKEWIASPILQDRYPSLFAGSKQMMDRLDSPNTALATAQLARIHSRYVDAKKVLEKASKTFPGNTTVLERLVEIEGELVELGLIDPDKAKQILVRLQSGPSTAGMEVLRGQLFETLGQADKAAIAYQAALGQKVDPKWTPFAEVRLAVLVSQAALAQK